MSVKIQGCEPRLFHAYGIETKTIPTDRPYLSTDHTEQAVISAGAIRHYRYGVDFNPIDIVSSFGDFRTVRGKRFLDIGCQSGNYVLAASQLGAEEAVGVDIEPHQAAFSEFARNRINLSKSVEQYFKPSEVLDQTTPINQGFLPNAYFEVADAADLTGFRPDHFDFINSLFLLQYMPDFSRIRPIDVVISAALSLGQEHLHNLDLACSSMGVIQGVKYYINHLGGESQSVAEIEPTERDMELLDMIWRRGRSGALDVLNRLGWDRYSNTCPPLQETGNSPRIKAFVRILEVIKSGGTIHLNSNLPAIPPKHYSDDHNWTMCAISEFGGPCPLTPRIETLDFLKLAAGVIKERTGISISFQVKKGQITDHYTVIKS